MASPDTNSCTLCSDQLTNKEASIWCTECEKFLCTDCENNHIITFENHKTISIEEHHKLPNFVQQISINCPDHKKKLEFVCSFHACPCCDQCLLDKHKQCQDFKPLPEILRQVKSSALVQLLEKDLKDVQESINEMIEYLKRSVKTCKIQKLKAISKIKHMKKSIDELFHKLEKEITDHLEYKNSELESEINSLMNQLTEQANRISQSQSDFSNVIQYATELQMYMGMREIEKSTTEAAQYIEDFKRRDNFEEKNLEVTISSALQSILEEVKSFGVININKSRSSTSILYDRPGRAVQAQSLVQNLPMVPTDPRIDLIKPSMLRTLTIPDDKKSVRIFACRILPDGKYLVLNNMHYKKSQLWLFNNDGTFKKEVTGKLPGSSWDACFFKDYTVAVTLGSANQTVLIDIEKRKTVKEIKLSHNCYGVESDGKVLFISSKEEITIVNPNNVKSTQILIGVKATFISLFQGNIYGTFSDEVCCYKSTGKPLWTFKHRDISFPQGIAIDNNGFIYIASYENNSIMLISPDGKNSKTILSEADGIKHPIAIDINRETGTMLVSSIISNDSEEKSSQKVFAFQI